MVPFLIYAQQTFQNSFFNQKNLIFYIMNKLGWVLLNDSHSSCGVPVKLKLAGNYLSISMSIHTKFHKPTYIWKKVIHVFLKIEILINQSKKNVSIYNKIKWWPELWHIDTGEPSVYVPPLLSNSNLV